MMIGTQKFVTAEKMCSMFPDLFVIVGRGMFFRRAFSSLSKRELLSRPRELVNFGYVYLSGLNDKANIPVHICLNIENDFDKGIGYFNIHPTIGASEELMALIFEMGFDIRHIDENDDVIYYDKTKIMRKATIKKITDEV